MLAFYCCINDVSFLLIVFLASLLFSCLLFWGEIGLVSVTPPMAPPSLEDIPIKKDPATLDFFKGPQGGPQKVLGDGILIFK